MTRHPFLFFLCVLCTLGGGLSAGYGMSALAAACFFCGGVGVATLAGVDLWERHNDELDSRTELVRARAQFVAEIKGSDEETRQFLAQEWPELGVEFGQEALAYLLKDGVNTHVLLHFLKAFLMDSTENSFVDVRNYNDNKTIQERFKVSRDTVRLQWKLLAEFLVEEGYLIAGSMAGNQTYRWTSAEHYKKLCRVWLNVREFPRAL